MRVIESRSARAWYNGSTSASQAEDEGSIPFARTKVKMLEIQHFCWIFIFGFGTHQITENPRNPTLLIFTFFKKQRGEK